MTSGPTALAQTMARIEAWFHAPLSEAETAELLADALQMLNFTEHRSPATLPKRLREAMEIILARPGISSADLAELLGVSTVAVHTFTYRLRQRGNIRSEKGPSGIPGGAYHFPIEEGAQLDTCPLCGSGKMSPPPSEVPLRPDEVNVLRALKRSGTPGQIVERLDRNLGIPLTRRRVEEAVQQLLARDYIVPLTSDPSRFARMKVGQRAMQAALAERGVEL